MAGPVMVALGGGQQEDRRAMASDMIDFNPAAAAIIDATYLTPDVVNQRLRVLETLALRPGDRVVDIGAGTGLMAYDMAKIVGPAGSVLGADLSEAMLTLARERCAGLPQARFEGADACALPLANDSIDAAVSMQVHEYVADTAKALGEIFRILRPGGRVSILDTAWDSVVWHTDDQETTERLLKTWERHCPHPNLPKVLGTDLRAAGFHVGRVEAIPLLNASPSEHAYSAALPVFLSGYCVGKDGITQDDMDRWLAGLRAVAERGEWFFSLNRYVFTAIKP